MIHFFKAVLNDNLTKAFDLKKTIDQFSYHFNSKEEQIYMLFSGLYFFKKNEWEEGKMCFEKSLDLADQIKEEDPYLYLELAKYCFQIQKTCLGFSYLERATTEFMKAFEKDWVFRCGILWCRESMRNGNVRNAEIRLKELSKLINPCKKHSQWSDLFIILGMVCEKRGKIREAEEYYKKSIEQRGGRINEEFLIDIIKFDYCGQNNDLMIKLIERLDLNVLSTRSRMLIDFYYFKAFDETDEHFEIFMRKDAIPFAMKGLDYQSVSLYTKELTNYHRRKLSYKKVADAYYNWEKFCDELNLIGVI
jgi:tetratricopeptide (TPR) repeat protein